MDKIKRALRAARPKYQDGGSLPFVSIPAEDMAKAQADPHRYERFFQPVATAVKSLGDLVKAPFDMARDARQAGGYSQLDPTDVGRAGLNTGLGTLMPAVGGVGGRGGAVLMSGAGPTDKKGITAYHGSPHDFDRFDMSKIGTGEGAQAYGHGLYFAESEGVAKSYRDVLAGANNRFLDSGKGRSIVIENPIGDGWQARMYQGEPGFKNRIDLPTRALDDKFFSTFDEALAHARKQGYISHENPALTYWTDGYHKPIDNAGIRDIEDLTGAQIVARDPGRMYEVRIDADPNDFLDWDKPLAEQSETVRKSLANVNIKPEMTGGWRTGDEVYALAGNAVPDAPDAVRQAAVSAKLREAGIPGIKYLDAGSRTAGEGSRNYVLFRDDIIQIVRKYGMAAAVSMYGADAVNDALQPMTGNDG